MEQLSNSGDTHVGFFSAEQRSRGGCYYIYSNKAGERFVVTEVVENKFNETCDITRRLKDAKFVGFVSKWEGTFEYY